MSPRTGRPTDDPKRNQVKIRMSDEEVSKLEFCAKKLGLTKAEVIRRGIDEMYKKVQEQK